MARCATPSADRRNASAELLEDAPPELIKHRTGASVFKFKEIDEHLATALDPYRDQLNVAKEGPDGICTIRCQD